MSERKVGPIKKLVDDVREEGFQSGVKAGLEAAAESCEFAAKSIDKAKGMSADTLDFMAINTLKKRAEVIRAIDPATIESKP